MTPRQADRSDATRAALIDAGIALFGTRGYSDVSIDEIAEEAGVTKGALYHHYPDKRAMFRAVFERVERDLTFQLAIAAGRGEDAREQVERGIAAFLDACMRPDVARITLLDAPSVLGWSEWKTIQARYGLGLVTGVLHRAMADGVMTERPVDVVASIIFGAIAEAGLAVAHSKDQIATRAVAESVLLDLFRGLR